MAAIFQHLLAPVDFSEKSDQTLDVVSDLAQRDAARVTLLHVVETLAQDDASLDEFYETLTDRAAKELAEHAEPLHAAGLEVEEIIVRGKPIAEVIKQIDALEVDLVVASSHRVDFSQGPRAWTSLSYQLSILCPCPVLLVK